MTIRRRVRGDFDIDTLTRWPDLDRYSNVIATRIHTWDTSDR
jgi:hypothetical protein